MTTRISYTSIDLAAPVRVFNGHRKVLDVCDANGVTITRIIDGSIDAYHIAGPNVVEGVEIDARAVVGGVRAKKPVLVGRGGKADKVVEKDAEA